MNRLLPVVFSLLVAASPLAAADTPRDPSKLKLASANVLVLDADGNSIYSKAADAVTPIASVTKLMTAMVVLAGAPLSRRHGQVRRSHERQGRAARPVEPPLRRPHRALAVERVHGEGP